MFWVGREADSIQVTVTENIIIRINLYLSFSFSPREIIK